MKRNTSASAKKPRWTREQKLAAQNSKSKSPAKSSAAARPERDQKPARRANSTSSTSSRWSKPERENRSRRGDFDSSSSRERPARRYDDRGPRRDDRRDDNRGYDNRGPRRDDRGFDNRRSNDRRDERGNYERRSDDRGYDNRGPRRDDRGYDDRRSSDRRDERGNYERRSDDRGYGNRGYDNRRSNDRRDERGNYQRRSDDRGNSNRRDDRLSNDRRDERGNYERRAPQRPVSRPLQTSPTRTQQEPIDLSDNGFAALGLPEVLVERLARENITEPFPIQTATIPDALAGRDVLGRGRTGSGKTLSFGLPTITRLMGTKARPNKPRAIVLVPTRELAMQVSDALQPLVHVAGLHHKLVAGGMPYEPQLSALARGVDILVATPGRLSDLIERGAADLSAVQIAILDEADHMAEMGFLEAITEILDLVPEGGQRLLFSATLDRGIDTVVERYLTDPVEHSTDDGTSSITTMEHHALLIEPRDKKIVTAELTNRPGRTVVFVRTKLGADRVAEELRDQGIVAAALHGGLNQSQRNKVLGAFKEGRIPVLVATDVAARGIHVDDVSLVLQIDPPADHKDYQHRAGRTARAGEAGTVVTLALPHQRKMVQRLLDDAGVGIKLTKARPGDDIIAAAGGSRPSGERISQSELNSLLTPPGQRGRSGGRPGGGYRGGQSRGPRRGGDFRGGDRRGGDFRGGDRRGSDSRGQRSDRGSDRGYSRAGRD